MRIENTMLSEENKEYSDYHFFDCDHLEFKKCKFVNCSFTGCTFGCCTSNSFIKCRFESTHFGVSHNPFFGNFLYESEFGNNIPYYNRHNGIFNNHFVNMDMSNFLPAFSIEFGQIYWDFNDFDGIIISASKLRDLAEKCTKLCCYDGDLQRLGKCGFLLLIDLSDLSLIAKFNLIANIIAKKPTVHGSYNYAEGTFKYHIDTVSLAKEHPAILEDSSHNNINNRIVPFSKDFSGTTDKFINTHVGAAIVWKPTDADFPTIDLNDVFTLDEKYHSNQKSKGGEQYI